MWFGVITLFPESFEVLTASGVFGRAVTQGTLSVNCFNPRDYTKDRHQTVDDRPYGGGPGMVMMVEPLLAAIDAARAAAPVPAEVVLLSPGGERFTQARALELAARDALILVCGRYEGVDERVVGLAIDREISVGDYVLTGGELPAMVVMDAVSRHIRGTLGNAGSALEESHLEGRLDYPHYTRPERVRGLSVPEVLLSGDHAAIRSYRLGEALKRTLERRPDLLAGRPLTEEERQLLQGMLSVQTTPGDA